MNEYAFKHSKFSYSSVGRAGFEPAKSLQQRSYSPSHLAALESPQTLISVNYFNSLSTLFSSFSAPVRSKEMQN
jgi:hypothetical protein